MLKEFIKQSEILIFNILITIELYNESINNENLNLHYDVHNNT